MLERPNHWGLDMFHIDGISSGHTLAVTGYHLFRERDLLGLFKIPDRLCVSFFLTVEQHYLKDVSSEKIHAMHAI